MSKKKAKDLDSCPLLSESNLQEDKSRDLILSEINALPKDLFKNVSKSYQEFRTADEWLQVRYGKPGSKTRKRFEARAQAFLASELPESSAITVDPEILGGTPVFSGTRIPIQNLIDHLTTEESIESFLNDFDGVTKLQVQRIVRKIMRFPD
ncbi:DUF433 domain-containing protein [Dyadobacter chenwenxiniae]|uniref:DUF433 domain-containing protein n=1 Tax=Dyadobacter chenwenxiniae TaxID=2906456 RepID=A0A9X1PGY3_9BACT|nr:DUF433 domain-containing protein [Dyadobacter chenwenxiniae]MCF0053834.1 DUF433 domain-containing protein [Dyadobacter chenwenxiniae]MCF0061147.1 DUF433 domain-containing protein [Dyadobacter chenwenxiniae]UON80974.1 DUF433 domain-containing protein [Dyadobacter chenwenxiniae]